MGMGGTAAAVLVPWLIHGVCAADHAHWHGGQELPGLAAAKSAVDVLLSKWG